MGFRQKLSLVLVAIIIVGLIRWLSSPDQADRIYSSPDALKQAQQKAGYVPIGLFGNSWPAVVTEVLEHDDSISFTRQNGTPHTYRGFEGYHLKVIRLQGSGGEVILVLRSISKRDGADRRPVSAL